MTRAVRVVTEVAAVDKAFDYLVPESLAHVGVGDRVRMNFNGRSVRGWVSPEEVGPSEHALKPLVKSLGFGPPPELWPVLEWAAWRWAAPLSRFLLAASPTRVVTKIPTPPTKTDVMVTEHFEPGVWQLAPTVDPLALVLSAYQKTASSAGSLLVLVPTEAWAQRLRGRLEQRGLAVAEGEGQWDRMRGQWPVIVGARGAAFAPTQRLAGAVIIDGDDEGYRSEASPTWWAPAVVAERCRRDGAPLWVTSVLPSPATLQLGTVHEEAGNLAQWPAIDIVDRRSRDPREGVLSEPALRAAHAALDGPDEVAVAVILQRLGTGRLFACRRCGELARCAVCGQAEVEAGEQLACPEGHGERENFCLACSATNLRKVRVGVTTLARDVGLQLRQEVTEITATTPPGPTARVVVGTEAVFGRLRRCGVVIFVDFDQYLLAPRDSARRHAVGAVTKAGRLVGPRRDGRGTVVLQTRRDDDVMTALRSGQLGALRDSDDEAALALGLAPYAATAEISGEGAAGYVASLDPTRLTIRQRDDVTTVRAAGVEQLCNALANATRTGGRLRVAVS